MKRRLHARCLGPQEGSKDTPCLPNDHVHEAPAENARLEVSDHLAPKRNRNDQDLEGAGKMKAPRPCG